MTKAEFIALLESMGAQDDTVLTFFHSSIHYADQDTAALAKFPGIHPSGVYVKVAA